MKRCPKCNININTDKKQCPLCFDELDGENDDGYIPAFNYAKYNDNTPKKNALLTKIFGFITICIITICLFINFFTGAKVWWSVLVAAGLLYVWILVRHTIISKRNLFEKMFFQVVGLFVMILLIDWISGGGSWFWNYFAPSAAIITSTVLLFILLINKKRSDYVVSSFVMTILMIGMSIALVLSKIDYKLLNWINIIYSGLFLLGILMFGFKSLKRGLQKNLHV